MSNYIVHGILWARILEWVTFPFSRDLPKPGIKPKSPALWVDSLPTEPQGKPKGNGVGSLSLLQGIFPTQGLNHLSYQGSPNKVWGWANLHSSGGQASSPGFTPTWPWTAGSIPNSQPLPTADLLHPGKTDVQELLTHSKPGFKFPHQVSSPHFLLWPKLDGLTKRINSLVNNNQWDLLILFICSKSIDWASVRCAAGGWGYSRETGRKVQLHRVSLTNRWHPAEPHLLNLLT